MGTLLSPSQECHPFYPSSLAYDLVVSPTGAVVEVKGGNDRELPSAGHIQYARAFFGQTRHVVSLSFSLDVERIGIQDGTIMISIKHTLEWIRYRIDWMNGNINSLSKTGSWAWSEEFLSDLLYLHRLG